MAFVRYKKTYFLHCSNSQNLVLSIRLKGCLSNIANQMYGVLLGLVHRTCDRLPMAFVRYKKTYFLHCSNSQNLVLSIRLKGCLSNIATQMYGVLLGLVHRTCDRLPMAFVRYKKTYFLHCSNSQNLVLFIRLKGCLSNIATQMYGVLLGLVHRTCDRLPMAFVRYKKTYFLHCSNSQNLVLFIRLKGCLSNIANQMYGVLLGLVHRTCDRIPLAFVRYKKTKTATQQTRVD